MRLRIAGIILVATSAMPARTVAQRVDGAAQIDSGRVVRLHTANGVTTGRLLAPLSRTDSAVRYCRYPGPPCLDPAEARFIPLAQVSHLDLQHGSALVKGAVIGGVIGGVLGGLLGAFAAGMRECSRCASSATIIAEGALEIGGFGAGLGALFGSTSLHWSVGPW